MKSFFTLGLVLLTSLSSFASDQKVIGLICSHEINGQELKVKVEIQTKGSRARLSFRNASRLTGMGSMVVPASGVTPILNGDLAKMNNVVLEDDGKGATIAFKVGGYTYDRRATLNVDVDLANQEMKLTSCNVEIEQSIRAF